MKAKAVNKPRVAKTYRLQQETIDQISKLAEKQKIAESEVVEKFIKKSYSSIFK